MEKLFKHFFSTVQGSIIVGVLIVASFFIGLLYTKIQYLEKGGAVAATNSQPVAAAGDQPSLPSSPGGKVNVDVGHLPIKGNKDAKVTIVEFADFRCPFCERFFKDAETSLVKDYVDTGKVKYAFRHYAFLGQQSVWAAQASECANEQGKFWKFHEWLYNNQAPESDLEYYSKDNLVKYAANVDIDTNQFASCLNSDKYAKQVQDDLSEGQKAGVNGTPTLFVNGIPIVGAQPYSAFKTVIDQELSK
ncbi:MAG: DsbA family protein [Candidatus Levybacteria bacterium]|nr:DsbA family protein [Candidatus Levybacteria bacterium]